MAETPSIDALATRLAATGVDPELARWCAERLDAGDPTELLQLVLLRQLWAEVLPKDGGSPLAVERWPALAAGGFPFLDGDAARRLLDAGAAPADLNALVRSAQVLLLYNACRILDDGGWKVLEALGLPGRGWAVVASDPAKTPRGSLGGLHSTFEQLDPSRGDE